MNMTMSDYPFLLAKLRKHFPKLTVQSYEPDYYRYRYCEDSNYIEYAIGYSCFLVYHVFGVWFRAERVFQGLWAGVVKGFGPFPLLSTCRHFHSPFSLSCITRAVGAVEMWETRGLHGLRPFFMRMHPWRQG